METVERTLLLAAFEVLLRHQLEIPHGIDLSDAICSCGGWRHEMYRVAFPRIEADWRAHVLDAIAQVLPS